MSRFHAPKKDLKIGQVKHLPINLITSSHVYDRLSSETLRRGDANIFLQDLFITLIDSGIPRYREMFDLLLDENSYPVILSDKFGKDYVGFASALILAALDVPEETIYDDFTLSNHYLDRRAILFDSVNCSSDTQEAATALMTVRKRHLFCAIRRIKQKYGSIQNYLEKTDKPYARKAPTTAKDTPLLNFSRGASHRIIGGYILKPEFMPYLCRSFTAPAVRLLFHANAKNGPR